METKQRILLTLGIAIVLVAGFFIITEAITKYTGFSITAESDIDNFKICLREKDIILYVNTNNFAESLSEIKLTEYLEDVGIVNCLRNKQVCLDAGVNSFPSWGLEGELAKGDIEIGVLSELSGCNII